MTIADFIDAASQFSLLILAAFILLPLAAHGYGKLIAKKNGANSPHKYVHAVIIYLAAIPGILAAVVTAYSLLFLHANLLQVNVVLHFVPILSMAATIIIVSRNVDLDHVPGFDRLSALFFVIAAAFIIALVIIKTRIFLFFGSSFLTLVILFAILLATLQSASKILVSGKTRPKRPDKPFP